VTTDTFDEDAATSESDSDLAESFSSTSSASEAEGWSGSGEEEEELPAPAELIAAEQELYARKRGLTPKSRHFSELDRAPGASIADSLRTRSLARDPNVSRRPPSLPRSWRRFAALPRVSSPPTLTPASPLLHSPCAELDRPSRASP
jgi:hypothetical protein